MKTNLPTDSPYNYRGEPKTISTEQLKIIKTQGAQPYNNVHCGLQDKDGNLWFGTTGEGVYRYNGKSFTNFTQKDGLCSNCVYSILEDKDGNIWFGTANGLCHYDGKAFTRLSNPVVAGKIKEVFSIMQDKTGNFWFGTIEGVFKYNGKSFTNFFYNDSVIKKSGFHLNVIQSILEDKAGNIWFASWEREGVCRYDGKSITSLKPNGDDMVYSILEDKEGNIWFGTRNHGACRYDGKTFTNFSDIENFNASCVYSMTEDKAGNIWFGTEGTIGGVWCYNPSASLITGSNTFTNFTTRDGLSNNSVFSVILDKSGKLWFGTRGIGLCSYDEKTFTHFSE